MWDLYLNRKNYFLFFSIIDQIDPVKVVNPPIISVKIVSSINPFVIKIPPTKVSVCLKMPNICSLDNFMIKI